MKQATKLFGYLRNSVQRELKNLEINMNSSINRMEMLKREEAWTAVHAPTIEERRAGIVQNQMLKRR